MKEQTFGHLARLAIAHHQSRAERVVIVEVEAFDESYPQHIAPQFTPDKARRLTRPIAQRSAVL